MNRADRGTLKWSWKAGEFFGIGVYVHATFLLLIGWVVLAHVLRGQGISSILAGVAFTLAIFGCVLMHEFGHALAARKYGIGTQDITLLPIGGVARLERMPSEPRQELWVALAGPAVNIAIAAGLFAALLAAGSMEPLGRVSVTGGPFLERLMVMNVFLALFNLLPAFPMDGGRILRALLATRIPYARATRIAARTGQGMALLFGLAGLFGNPFLIFIALFVWMGAAQEAAAVDVKSALSGIPVSHVMETDFRWLTPNDRLSRATEYMLAGSQQNFPVVLGDQAVGMLTRSALMATLGQKGPQACVGEAMQREFESVDFAEPLGSAFERLQASGCPAMPVSRNGRLVGIVTEENVVEFLMIQASINSGGSGFQTAPRWSQGI